MAAIAAHLGEVDEDKINNMAYIFFQDVLAALGKKINYESISNLYGRTVLDKKGGQAITESIAKAYPLSKPNTKNSAFAMMNLPGAMTIIENSKNQKKEAERVLGDMSWFEDALI